MLASAGPAELRDSRVVSALARRAKPGARRESAALQEHLPHQKIGILGRDYARRRQKRPVPEAGEGRIRARRKVDRQKYRGLLQNKKKRYINSRRGMKIAA